MREHLVGRTGLIRAAARAIDLPRHSAIDGFDFVQALALLDAILATADGGASSDAAPANTPAPTPSLG